MDRLWQIFKMTQWLQSFWTSLGPVHSEAKEMLLWILFHHISSIPISLMSNQTGLVRPLTAILSTRYTQCEVAFLLNWLFMGLILRLFVICGPDLKVCILCGFPLTMWDSANTHFSLIDGQHAELIFNWTSSVIYFVFVVVHTGFVAMKFYDLYSPPTQI